MNDNNSPEYRLLLVYLLPISFLLLACALASFLFVRTILENNGEPQRNVTSLDEADTEVLSDETESTSNLPNIESLNLFEVVLRDIEGNVLLGDLETGETVVTEIVGVIYEGTWAPNGKWFAVRTEKGGWIVDAYDASVFQLQTSDFISSLTWSPDSTFLISWETGSGLRLFDILTNTVETIPGTEKYGCNRTDPAWSFDEQFIIFSATQGACGENGPTESVMMSLDGVQKKVYPGHAALFHPSPIDYKVAYNTFNLEDSVWELFLTDFSSWDSPVLVPIRRGSGYFWTKWQTDGTGVYTFSFNARTNALYFIDASSGEVDLIADGFAELGKWSPDGTQLVFNGWRVRVRDLGTSNESTWVSGLSNVCGYHWDEHDILSHALDCRRAGDLPVSEVFVVDVNGNVIPLGTDLYEVMSVNPGSEGSAIDFVD